MFGLTISTTDDFRKVEEAEKKATVRALKIAGFAIRADAIKSIEQSPDASAPGQPPHSRRGQLRRAILYDVDASSRVAVVGPRATLVGESAQAHEFGGAYKKQDYPARPFMRPALDQELDKIPAGFSGQISS